MIQCIILLTVEYIATYFTIISDHGLKLCKNGFEISLEINHNMQRYCLILYQALLFLQSRKIVC